MIQQKKQFDSKKNFQLSNGFGFDSDHAQFIELTMKNAFDINFLMPDIFLDIIAHA